MENKKLKIIMLKSAFSFMACDGDIDERELNILNVWSETHQVFDEINVEELINSFIDSINKEGVYFLEKYLHEISNGTLTRSEQMQVIDIAVDVIFADDKVEDSEKNFLVLLANVLHFTYKELIKMRPEIEQYIKQEALLKSKEDHFENYRQNQKIPQFNLVDLIGKELRLKLDDYKS